MIRLSEDRLVESLTNFLETCDADVLAMFAGLAFGGQCFFAPNGMYDFEPDESYGGEFGYIDTEE